MVWISRYDTGSPRSSSAMLYSQLQDLHRQRVSDGAIVPVFSGVTKRVLVLVWSQLGDFDSVEYAIWLQREAEWLSKQIGRAHV